MGTVGVNIHVFIQGGITLWSVKLNNPLMGTDVDCFIVYSSLNISNIVLN